MFRQKLEDSVAQGLPPIASRTAPIVSSTLTSTSPEPVLATAAQVVLPRKHSAVGYDMSPVPAESRLLAVPDPTTLIVVDEADRLAMNSLEQLRSIFDKSGLGMVLIRMPGIEKRVARYPQLFSRIGFVHEFRALNDANVQDMLKERWAPAGIHLPDSSPNPEVIAAVIRLTRGSLPLARSLADTDGT